MMMIPMATGQGTTTYTTIIIEAKLEDVIVKALRFTMRVVALGKPGETFGVGRILSSEDTWQRTASDLIRRASLIICLPSGRPGSKWELDEILTNDYLQKTVFLMPPDPSMLRWKQLRQDWALVKDRLAAFGVETPKYRKSGMLFAIDSMKRCFTQKLDLHSEKKILEAVKKLVPGCVPDHSAR